MDVRRYALCAVAICCTVAACTTHFGNAGLQPCGTDGRCGVGLTCTPTSLGPLCLTEAQRAELCGHPERCDGVDNDCDGLVDDGIPSVPCYTGPPSTEGVGTCIGGDTACVSGSTQCIGQVLPNGERCDGLDQNCDGVADDSLALQLGTECVSGMGACARVGVYECNPDFSPSGEGEREGVVCDAEPGLPSPEICNGIDDDCDGSVDETADLRPVFIGSDVGDCEPAVIACVGGTTTEIDPGQGPSSEICDSRDNDCSGTPDDGIPSVSCYTGPVGTEGVGICAGGDTTCESGTLLCIGQSLPVAETCDGFDNNCDGTTDGTSGAPLSQPCYSGPSGTLGIGACIAGTTTCSSGVWGDCVGEVVPNDCGGCTVLVRELGTPCGGCGTWECDGADLVMCNDSCPNRSCRALRDTDGVTESGVYTITPGAPASGDLDVYCDMETDDGGWTLILAYAHPAGANDPLVIGTAPTDPVGGYSHMSMVQLQSLGFSELRFYCETSIHSRKVHFKTSVPGAVDYVRGMGSNNAIFWSDGFTVLAEHSAALPSQADSILSVASDLRLTDHPFFQWGIAHWNIRTQDSRWECDDIASMGNATLHAVWAH